MCNLRQVAAIAGVAVMVTVAYAQPAGATFAGRNGLIAFVADTGSGNQIYTVRPNGHALRRITNVDGEALAPDWSPDGSRIAFAWNECNIALMDPDGSDMTVLASETPGGCETDPSFTPDGARLVYERYDPSIEDDAVWTMNVDGSDRRPVTSAGAPDPNVSPDGEKVSFMGGTSEETSAIFTTALDGGDLFQVTSPSGVAFKHDWAPDGGRIVFTDNANDTSRPSNIATIRPDGTGLRYLTDNVRPDQRAYVGSYSPDGRWIVFRGEDGGTNALYRMRPDGGALHTILPASDFRPRFIDWGAA
jgi:Tol biopolymer transport system component